LEQYTTQNNVSEGTEISLLNVEIEQDSSDKITSTTWQGDTGASCHLCTNSDEGMFIVQMNKSPVKIGSGKTTTNQIGKEMLDRYSESRVYARHYTHRREVCTRTMG
jgi:hypothetical protein